jgi:tRNA nucleotidyltransferase (CCA-adding enzyme)
MPTGAEPSERIAALPGVAQLLPALEGLPSAYLVGGAVRDTLLGAREAHLDLAFEGDAIAAGRVLAERLGGRLVEHERFGTAVLAGGEVPLDLAGTRRESYPTPGALPVVEPAALSEDLARRDYSVNAIAAPLGPDGVGVLIDPHGGVEDLQARRLRMLHDRSFADDPTRIVRALRYHARLGLELDHGTHGQALKAIAAGAMQTISADRLGHELMLLLDEPSLHRGLVLGSVLGLDRAIHPDLNMTGTEPALAADYARAAGARPAVAALAGLIFPAPDALITWTSGLGLEASVRDDAVAAAVAAPRLVEELRADPAPSVLYGLLRALPAESGALALALGAPTEQVDLYENELRDTRLEISGDDLVAAGVPQSPAIGRALGETLRRKLDGEIAGREAELETALELARADA